MDYTEIMQNISKTIISSVDSLLKDARFDKTFRAQVIESLGNKKYKVRYRGIEYIAKCDSNIEINTWVYVCAPQNNWNELFIYGL